MRVYRKMSIVLLAGIIILPVILIKKNGWVGLAQAQGPAGSGPFVSEPVTPKLSRAVRQLPTLSTRQAAGPVPEVNPRRVNPQGQLNKPGEANTPDPLLPYSLAPTLLKTPAVITSFAGISFATGGSGVPPDPNGDVGPNHYVQMVNSSFAIYNKSGGLLTGPTAINQLWAGAGGNCEANNDGDPIVLYDGLADRWLLSQFSSPNHICAAVSQSADPTGAYFLYEFNVSEFPDYFKFGVWPDAYYMSANQSTYTAFAFDRARMLAGLPATFQKFTGQTNLLLPSDLDGPLGPPAGSPDYFYTFKDSSFHGGGVDRLEVFAFHADFTTPANSTFTLVASIPVAGFTYTVCGFFTLACIPQPAPGEKVDAVSEWPMWRLAYHNFGTHEALVGNFTVDVGSGHAGIRWFELHKSGGGTWTLYQEGTHAPDAHHRFMGSIAQDKDGNIALGYTTSSATLTPTLRYATRLASDPLGTLQSEVTLIAGGGVQTSGFNRWGDYSAMSIDPADECTFWYTGEYYAATSAGSWTTRVGAFKIPSCTPYRKTFLPVIWK